MTDETLNVYDEALRADGSAIEAYIENIYSKSVPPPEPPTSEDLSFWRIAGLESSIFVLSSLGAAVLSAIRTGGLFFLLEVLLMQKFKIDPVIGNGLGAISMVSSLLAFEGFLVGYGLVRGRRSGRMEVSNTGMIISLITVISAGVFSSFSIVTLPDNVELIMNILLAVITGGASAFVAFFSSENFGYILNHVTGKKSEIQDEHRKNYSKWREEGVATYKKSTYNIRRKGSEHIYNKQDQNVPEPEEAYETPQPKQKKRVGEQVKEFLGEFVQANGRIPMIKEIQAVIPVGDSSAYYPLIEFIVENQVYLLQNGILDEKKIEDSIASLAKKNKANPDDYRKYR